MKSIEPSVRQTSAGTYQGYVLIHADGDGAHPSIKLTGTPCTTQREALQFAQNEAGQLASVTSDSYDRTGSIRWVPRRARKPRRILVVDDNRAAADLVVKLLKLLGHEALAEYDAVSALSAADKFEPDVIFMDLVMPRMDGFEAGQLIRELKGASVKLIALSAFAQPEVREATIAAGFDALLAKPATAESIQQMLDG